MRNKYLAGHLGWFYNKQSETLEHIETIDAGVTVPDIVRNPREKDGWRKPSPYSCMGTAGSFLYAECYAEGYRSTKFTSYFRGNSRGYHPRTFKSVRPKDCSWVLPTVPADADFPSALRARAINTALAQLQNRQGHILETIAEFRSSIQGLARNAQSITAFSDAFERSVRTRSAAPMRKHFGLPKKHRALREWQRKVNGTVLAAKTFGSAWLTFWFGLAPIVSDMVLFMRILGDSNLYNQNLSGRGRGFTRTTMNTSWSILRGFNAAFDDGFIVKSSVKRELGVRVDLHCNLNKNWVMKRAREAAQLGSFDGFSTIWAVMPYSWLIDFVLPVSQYLKGWEGRQGLDFRGGTITYYQSYTDPKVKYEKIGTKSHIEPFGKPVIYGPRTFRRHVLSNLPAPVFQPRLPADFWKATTALSLLATKLNLYLGDSPRRA